MSARVVWRRCGRHAIGSRHMIPTHLRWILWNADNYIILPKKRLRSRLKRARSWCLFYEIQQKPTDIIGENPKDRPNHFHFRLTTITMATPPMKNGTERLLVSWRIFRITAVSWRTRKIFGQANYDQPRFVKIWTKKSWKALDSSLFEANFCRETGGHWLRPL